MLATVLLGPAGPRLAQAGRRIALVSTGSCPARDTVISALAQAMPDATIVASGADSSGDAEPVVVLSDGGASYRAVVRGVVRTLVDAPAHCEERARKVAVVAALALEPPLVASPQAEALEAAVEHPAAATSSRTAVQLETGAVAERAWLPGVRLAPSGGAVRVGLERDGLGLVIGATLLGWSDAGAGLLQRTPIDLALQLRRRASWLAGAVELGPSLVVQRSKDGNDRATRVELDLRLSARAELWFRPGVGVFAAITGTYVPNPAPLVGRGLAVPLPSWWLGGSAGLVLRIR